MGKRAVFFRNFVKQPLQNASAVPSSSFAAQAMTTNLNWSDSKYVVELGPGTGVFTERIYHHLSPQASCLVLELENSYVEGLRNRYGHRIEVLKANAQDVESHVKERNWPRVDLVISGLPFSLPKEVLEPLKNTYHSWVNQGTVVRCFTYFPFAMKHAYSEFHCELVKFVPLNFPPMWIYELKAKEE